MLAPYLRLPFAGVVWYQGEGNAWRGRHYRPQLAALLAKWRERFGRADLPFLIVQLPSFAGKDMDPDGEVWTDLREAQAQVADADDHSHLVVAVDLGDPKDIHPTSKRPLAERLAASALRHVHGRSNVLADPPRVTKTEPIPGGMAVEFDRAVALRSDAPSDFQLAETGGAFHAAKEVRQRLPQKLDVLAASGNPTELRYAWKNVAKTALRGPEGLPSPRSAPTRGRCRRTASFDKQTSL